MYNNDSSCSYVYVYLCICKTFRQRNSHNLHFQVCRFRFQYESVADQCIFTIRRRWWRLKVSSFVRETWIMWKNNVCVPIKTDNLCGVILKEWCMCLAKLVSYLISEVIIITENRDFYKGFNGLDCGEMTVLIMMILARFQSFFIHFLSCIMCFYSYVPLHCR